MHTTRGRREVTSSASSRVGWFGAISNPGSSRKASIADRSNRASPATRISPSRARKPPMIMRWPNRLDRRRGSNQYSTLAGRFHPRKTSPKAASTP
jgi:hypothetical protein